MIKNFVTKLQLLAGVLAFALPASFAANATSDTAAVLQQSLEIIKQRLLAAPTQPKIITINAWNEWTESSYLEQESIHGMGYLEAIKAVFGSTK